MRTTTETIDIGQDSAMGQNISSGKTSKAEKGGKKEKRMARTEMNRLNYSGDECNVGRSEESG